MKKGHRNKGASDIKPYLIIIWKNFPNTCIHCGISLELINDLPTKIYQWKTHHKILPNNPSEALILKYENNDVNIGTFTLKSQMAFLRTSEGSKLSNEEAPFSCSISANSTNQARTQAVATRQLLRLLPLCHRNMCLGHDVVSTSTTTTLHLFSVEKYCCS